MNCWEWLTNEVRSVLFIRKISKFTALTADDVRIYRCPTTYALMSCRLICMTAWK